MGEERQLGLATDFSQFLHEPMPGPRYNAANSQYGQRMRLYTA